MKSTVYHWRIDTPNFTFDAYGIDADHCAAVMRAAWRKHKQLTGATVRLAELADGTAPRAVTTGSGWRDGLQIVEGIPCE